MLTFRGDDNGAVHFAIDCLFRLVLTWTIGVVLTLFLRTTSMIILLGFFLRAVVDPDLCTLSQFFLGLCISCFELDLSCEPRI